MRLYALSCPCVFFCDPAESGGVIVLWSIVWDRDRDHHCIITVSLCLHIAPKHPVSLYLHIAPKHPVSLCLHISPQTPCITVPSYCPKHSV